MSKKPLLSEPIRKRLMDGVVIPAHPLALNSQRKFDPRRQKALTRYYCESGAGGVAVGVHTTQFEIREAKFGLYQPVLELAAETFNAYVVEGNPPLVRVAGIAGTTKSAVAEAELAASLGYHLGLVSLAAFPEATNQELIDHMEAVSDAIPVFGFYLQTSVGGRRLDYEFWRRLTEIDNLAGIKMAPFNRYQTLDVIRAVHDSDRANEIALYTGNDDNIIIDLVSQFNFGNGGNPISIRGGLLGQWAVWTHQAAKDLERIRTIRTHSKVVPGDLMTRAHQLTDANAAIFDAANGFAGCIPGIHEILRRQGLLEGRWTLDPNEELSPGQMEAIDRIYAAYPGLNDDQFVKENLDKWLS